MKAEKNQSTVERPFPDLYLVWKAAHENAIPAQFTHVARTEFPDLGCNAILLHKRFLREMKLQRVILFENQRNGVRFGQIMVVDKEIWGLQLTN